ncbi:hypothetical protein PI124_g12603 [Phytophthora idaei]|nr:hypothetical protein PI125_g6893 [Phytophthora idaei]KAG3161499.1 hypothetical protein PI126_g6442 [Phytophthora idaei]KAG3242551.1 hypothetical protein PI124_g12603 [Phytophthora idaei]
MRHRLDMVHLRMNWPLLKQCQDANTETEALVLEEERQLYRLAGMDNYATGWRSQEGRTEWDAPQRQRPSSRYRLPEDTYWELLDADELADLSPVLDLELKAARAVNKVVYTKC